MNAKEVIADLSLIFSLGTVFSFLMGFFFSYAVYLNPFFLKFISPLILFFGISPYLGIVLGAISYFTLKSDSKHKKVALAAIIISILSIVISVAISYYILMMFLAR